MAEEQKFPPQSQAEQPGKQHLMDPIPQDLHPDYRQANKLHVNTQQILLCSFNLHASCSLLTM